MYKERPPSPYRPLNTLLHRAALCEDLINSHGEYAWRGGIVDVFSPWQPFPFRIEFSGDEVVSLREFDPSSQRSRRKIGSILLPSLREYPSSPQFLREWEELAKQKGGSRVLKDIKEKTEQLERGDFFPSFVYLSLLHKDHYVPFTNYLEDSLFIIDDTEEVEREWEEIFKDLGEQSRELYGSRKFHLPPEEIYPTDLWEKIREEAICFEELGSPKEKKTLVFPFQSVPRFDNKIPFFLQYLKRLQEERERCFIYFSSQGVRQKLASLLSQHQILHVESTSPFDMSSSKI